MGTTIQKKKLKIYLTTNYSSTTTTGGSPSQNSYSGMNNLFYSVWGYRPVTEPDRPLNSLMDNIMDDAINNTNDYRFNPIMSLKNEYRKTYANYIQFNGFAEYEFIKGLKLKVSGGYTFDTRKGETFNNSKTRYGNPKSSDKVNAEIYHSQRATWLNENILTYQTNIKRKHFFNSMVGVTLQNSDYEYYSYKTVQIPNVQENGLYNSLGSFGRRPDRANRLFEAVVVKGRPQELMGTPKNTAGFHVERISWSQDTRIEFCESYMRGDMIQFFSEIQNL